MRTQAGVAKKLVVVPGNEFIVPILLGHIESVAADIESITVRAGEVIGEWYQAKMRGHERIQRMKRDSGQVEKIDRLRCTARSILENAVSCRLRQNTVAIASRLSNLEKLFE